MHMLREWDSWTSLYLVLSLWWWRAFSLVSGVFSAAADDPSLGCADVCTSINTEPCLCHSKAARVRRVLPRHSRIWVLTYPLTIASMLRLTPHVCASVSSWIWGSHTLSYMIEAAMLSLSSLAQRAAGCTSTSTWSLNKKKRKMQDQGKDRERDREHIFIHKANHVRSTFFTCILLCWDRATNYPEFTGAYSNFTSSPIIIDISINVNLSCRTLLLLL